MKTLLACLLIICPLCAQTNPAIYQPPASPRATYNFNPGWKFIREDVPRILGSVRGAGYKVLRPADYAPAALAKQTEARRKMTSAVDLMRTAPLNDMSPAQRDWAHKVTMVLIDNELRLHTQEAWRTEAEKRLAELERRAGIEPAIEVEVISDSDT